MQKESVAYIPVWFTLTHPKNQYLCIRLEDSNSKLKQAYDFNIYTLRGYRRNPCLLHFCNAVYRLIYSKTFPRTPSSNDPLFRYNDDICAISIKTDVWNSFCVYIYISQFPDDWSPQFTRPLETLPAIGAVKTKTCLNVSTWVLRPGLLLASQTILQWPATHGQGLGRGIQVLGGLLLYSSTLALIRILCDQSEPDKPLVHMHVKGKPVLAMGKNKTVYI